MRLCAARRSHSISKAWYFFYILFIMISTFSQMNPIVINTADMDALAEVLLKFSWWGHGFLASPWNFVFYNQTNEQYDTKAARHAHAAGEQRGALSVSNIGLECVYTQLYTRVVSTAVLYFLLWQNKLTTRARPAHAWVSAERGGSVNMSVN